MASTITWLATDASAFASASKHQALELAIGQMIVRPKIIPYTRD